MPRGHTFDPDQPRWPDGMPGVGGRWRPTGLPTAIAGMLVDEIEGTIGLGTGSGEFGPSVEDFVRRLGRVDWAHQTPRGAVRNLRDAANATWPDVRPGESSPAAHIKRRIEHAVEAARAAHSTAAQRRDAERELGPVADRSLEASTREGSARRLIAAANEDFASHVGHSEARGPTGRLRNIRQMGDDNLRQLNAGMGYRPQEDPLAIAAIQGEMARRGIIEPPLHPGDQAPAEDLRPGVGPADEPRGENEPDEVNPDVGNVQLRSEAGWPRNYRAMGTPLLAGVAFHAVGTESEDMEAMRAVDQALAARTVNPGTDALVTRARARLGDHMQDVDSRAQHERTVRDTQDNDAASDAAEEAGTEAREGGDPFQVGDTVWSRGRPVRRGEVVAVAGANGDVSVNFEGLDGVEPSPGPT